MPICVPSLSRRTTPEKAALAARPTRWIVTLLTVTSEAPAVTTNFVNGTRDALSGARPAAGWTVVETDRPEPVGVGVITTPPIEFNFARVAAPTYPVPAERPTGAKTSEAYLFWNLMTAAFVKAPKVDVSFPFEPTPEAATWVAESELRTFWRFITSAPVLPILRSVVKVYEGTEELPCNEESCVWSDAIVPSKLLIWAVSSSMVAAAAGVNPTRLNTIENVAKPATILTVFDLWILNIINFFNKVKQFLSEKLTCNNPIMHSGKETVFVTQIFFDDSVLNILKTLDILYRRIPRSTDSLSTLPISYVSTRDK